MRLDDISDTSSIISSESLKFEVDEDLKRVSSNLVEITSLTKGNSNGPRASQLIRNDSFANLQAEYQRSLELGRANGDADEIFHKRRQQNKWDKENLSEEMEKAREEQIRRDNARRLQLGWEFFITISYGFGMMFVPYFIAFKQDVTTSEITFLIFFEFVVVVDLCISHYYFVFGKSHSVHINYSPDFHKETNKRDSYFHETNITRLVCLEWIGGFPYQSILIFCYGSNFLLFPNVLKTSFILMILRIQSRDRIQRMYAFSQHNNFNQLIRLLIFSAVIMWYLCCVGFSISCFSDTETSWCKTFKEEYATELEMSIQFCYLISVAIQGENIQPSNIYEAWFSLVVSVFGAAMVALVFGAIYVLVETYSHGQRKFEETLGIIEHAASVLRLPEQLTEDIKAYNDYTQSKYSSGQFEHFKSLMTEHLSEEVSYWQFGEYITGMELLEDCSVPFIRLICNKMQLGVYAPGDIIIEQGDKDSTMFLVYEGEVGVYVRKGNERPPGKLVETQSNGSFFGEVSLLYSSLRRTATVTALKFCDIYKLTKEDLERIINRYPDDAEIMFANANRLMKKRYSKERLKAMFDISEPGATPRKKKNISEFENEEEVNETVPKTKSISIVEGDIKNYGAQHLDFLQQILENVQTIKTRTGELNYEFGKMEKRFKKIEKDVGNMRYQDPNRVEGELDDSEVNNENVSSMIKSEKNKSLHSEENLVEEFHVDCKETAVE